MDDEDPIFLGGERRYDLEAHRARILAQDPEAFREAVTASAKARASREHAVERKRVRAARTGRVDRRLAEGRRRSAAAGNFTSGVVPYGYRRTKSGRLDPHPVEAEAVRAIFRVFCASGSVARVVTALAGKVRSPRGRGLSPAWLHYVLSNETYTGVVRYGNVQARATFPAIVDPEVFEEARALLRLTAKAK